VIAFGSAITRPDVYDRSAAVGIEAAREEGSVVLALPAAGTIFESYNRIIDAAAELVDLEALVLVHQDTEIADPGFVGKVRAALADPDVGVMGCVGAIGVRSIAWWEGSVTLASFVNRYTEHGGGDLPAFSWIWDDAPAYARAGEVETLDGFLLVLPARTVRELRFDESLGGFHGYDLDFCAQVREAGRKVITIDVRAVHHRQLEMIPDLDEWIEAHIRVAEKWHGRVAGIGEGAGSWRERALRAEAERDAAHLMAATNRLHLEARETELVVGRRELLESLSWRLTAPLRGARG
jgi:hypothetical protein